MILIFCGDKLLFNSSQNQPSARIISRQPIAESSQEQCQAVGNFRATKQYTLPVSPIPQDSFSAIHKIHLHGSANTKRNRLRDSLAHLNLANLAEPLFFSSAKSAADSPVLCFKFHRGMGAFVPL